jgi:hypothetical protein
MLSVPTHYDFQCTRELVVSRSLLNPIYAMHLTEKHDIPEWLASDFDKLCQRVDPGSSIRPFLLVQEKSCWRDTSRPRDGGLSFFAPVRPSLLYDPETVREVIKDLFFPPNSSIINNVQ